MMDSGLNSPAKILLMDSGVGGLTVAEEVINKIPHVELTYIADQQWLPYGNKPADLLIQRLIELAGEAIDRFQPDILVVACNTASTLVLPYLRELFSVPIVGVVPAIKTAAEISSNKTIGVLATEGTVTREYTHQLIKDFAQDCDIHFLGCNQLVKIAENKLMGKPVSLSKTKKMIEPLTSIENLDTIVLGCTHFPLLKPELKQTSNKIEWIDSGKAIASRCLSLLTHSTETATLANTSQIVDQRPTHDTVSNLINEPKAYHRFFTTDTNPPPIELVNWLSHRGFRSFELLIR